MTQFTQLSSIRSGKSHRPAIVGQVLDGGTGAPLSGVKLQLTSMPESFTKRLALKGLQYGTKWETHPQRPDRLLSRPDGSFCFTDLPSGSYTVTASLPEKGTRYGTVSVVASVDSGVDSSADASALPTMLILRLPPTGVQGLVSQQLDGELDPIPLARLQIQGSGEGVASDPDGNFSLYGIEPGARTLLASARGFQPLSIAVVLQQGSVTRVEVALEPLSSP